MLTTLRKVVGTCLSVTLSFGATACGSEPHVGLNAPSARASFEERGRAYDQLKPLSMHETHTTYLQGGSPVGSERTTDYLQLADGRRVYHAEDILSVVPSDSAAATAALESESYASSASTFKTVYWVLFTVGGLVMITPLLSAGDGDVSMTPVLVGGGVMLAGIPFIFMAKSKRNSANDAKATAFETYEPGLRKTLNLCAKDGKVFDCAAPPARVDTGAATVPTAPAAPPAPAITPQGVGAGETCGGLAGFACAQGLYCAYPVAALCGAADQPGTCAIVPETCPEQRQLVCGCDDRTYPNACEAARRGISIRRQGDCHPASAPSQGTF